MEAATSTTGPEGPGRGAGRPAAGQAGSPPASPRRPAPEVAEGSPAASERSGRSGRSGRSAGSASARSLRSVSGRSVRLHHSLRRLRSLFGGEARPVCRICRDASEDEADEDEEAGAGGAGLVSMGCACKGELGLVHLACLEDWMAMRKEDSAKCEVCGFAMPQVLVDRPELLARVRARRAGAAEGHLPGTGNLPSREDSLDPRFVRALCAMVVLSLITGIVIATLNGLRTLNVIEGLHAPSPHPTAHQGEMPEGDAGYPWYDGN